jgi:hypothetical protein
MHCEIENRRGMQITDQLLKRTRRYDKMDAHDEASASGTRRARLTEPPRALGISAAPRRSPRIGNASSDDHGINNSNNVAIPSARPQIDGQTYVGFRSSLRKQIFEEDV